MNEKKKIMIVIGVILAFIAFIVFAMYQTNLKKQKVVDDFYDVFNSETEEIVYLGRPDCSVCTTFAPVLEEVVVEYKLSYLDINTNDVTEKQLRTIVEELGLDWDDFGTPTLAVVKDGQVIRVTVGALDKESLVTLLKDSNVISE